MCLLEILLLLSAVVMWSLQGCYHCLNYLLDLLLEVVLLLILRILRDLLLDMDWVAVMEHLIQYHCLLRNHLVVHLLLMPSSECATVSMLVEDWMRCDLAAFEASADGHKYCLVAAVTIEIDKEPKLLHIFVAMPKKDAVCAVAALKDKLTLCIAICIKSPVLELCVSKQTEEVSLPIKSSERRILYCHTLQLISHLLMVLQSAWLESS